MDDSNSDGELVIDESIVVSSDEDDELKADDSIREGNRFHPVAINTSYVESNESICEGNIFHPISISASDMKEALFHDDTNTCSICNESFRYNVGLIYHLEMEHLELKTKSTKSKVKKLTKEVQQRSVRKPTEQTQRDVILKRIPTNKFMKIAELNSKKLKLATAYERKSCRVCKKVFNDQVKLAKHALSCSKIGIKFRCMYCKSVFSWESKYKKHLFKIHKLNAAVICKDCSRVFPTVTEMTCHSRECSKRSTAKEPASATDYGA